jgi:hypothetical protein
VAEPRDSSQWKPFVNATPSNSCDVSRDAEPTCVGRLTAPGKKRDASFSSI